MTVSIREFKSELIAIGIFAEEDFEQLLREAPALVDSTEALARELIRRGKLTEYQAQTIVRGDAERLRFGNYLVQDKIGAGGMGQVYRAVHGRMKRIVALKVLPAELMQDQTLVIRFQREVQAAARLSHPNVVTAFDADEHRGIHYYVMEYVDGTDLCSLVKQSGVLRVERAVNYILQAARGLEYAHQEGITHRDVKPANLLVDRKGTVKVLDLGLARIDEDEAASLAGLTATGTAMGTIDYMSPEQALDTRHADARSDIYSLGCTLWYLLIGGPVYRGGSAAQKLLAHRDQPVPSLLNAVNSNSSAGAAGEALTLPVQTLATVDSVFQRMVAKDPEARYQTMAEVIPALEGCFAPTAGVVYAPMAMDGALEDSALERFFRSQAKGNAATGVGSDAADSAHGETLSSGLFEGTIAQGLTRLQTKTTERKSVLCQKKVIIPAAILAMFMILGGILLPEGLRKMGVDTPGKVTKSGLVAAVDHSSAGKKFVDDVATADPAILEMTSNNDRAIAEWVFSKGGTVSVSCPPKHDELDHIYALEELPDCPFRTRGIRHVEGVTDEDFLRFNGLTHLDRLQLYNQDITGEGLRNLRNVPELGSLGLWGTHIRDEDLHELKRFPQLHALQLADTDVTAAGLDILRELANLDDLNLRGLSLTDADSLGLTQYAKLLKLDIGRTRITVNGIRELAAMPLKCFFLQSLELTDNDLAPLSEMTSLAELELSRNPGITDEGLKHLEPLEHLELLILLETNVTPAGVEALRKKLPHCTIQTDFGAFAPAGDKDREVAEWVLSVGGKVIVIVPGDELHQPATVEELPGREFELRYVDLQKAKGITDEDFRRFQGLAKLSSLEIRDSEVTGGLFRHLRDLPELNTLWLYDIAIQNEDLLELKRFPNLQDLRLNGTVGITSECIDVLEELPSLRCLHLNVPLSDADMPRLAALTNLSTLYVIDTYITSAGVRQLASATHLTRLGIGSLEVTDADLAPLSAMTRLQVLGIWKTPGITGDGFKHFIPLTDLKVINVDHSGIDDAGLEQLRPLKSLKFLSIHHSPVTAEGVKKLQEMRPDIKIETDFGVFAPAGDKDRAAK